MAVRRGASERPLGRLVRDGVVVEGEGVEELARRGYGEKRDGKLLLKEYEALYLLSVGWLRVVSERCELKFEELVSEALRRDPDAWVRFLIYRDLRSRGYVVKEGFGFPLDFRVYERGCYGRKPARYVVFGVEEGKGISVEEFCRVVEEVRRMGKEAVVAVVERRGEVVYYRVEEKRLTER